MGPGKGGFVLLVSKCWMAFDRRNQHQRNKPILTKKTEGPVALICLFPHEIPPFVEKVGDQLRTAAW